MFGLGMTELIVILLILLLLFGASRLPGIAAGLGGAINTFKKSVNDKNDEPAPKQIESGSAEKVSETSKETTTA